MSDYHSFDQAAIADALEAIKRGKESEETVLSETLPNHNLLMSSGCVKMEVKDHKICIELPLHFGKHCIPIPKKIPNGAEAQVCLHICSKWHIPKGVKVTVTVDGIQVASASFGSC